MRVIATFNKGQSMALYNAHILAPAGVVAEVLSQDTSGNLIVGFRSGDQQGLLRWKLPVEGGKVRLEDPILNAAEERAAKAERDRMLEER